LNRYGFFVLPPAGSIAQAPVHPEKVFPESGCAVKVIALPNA
jgi:hypothetical protein